MMKYKSSNKDMVRSPQETFRLIHLTKKSPRKHNKIKLTQNSAAYVEHEQIRIILIHLNVILASRVMQAVSTFEMTRIP